MEINYACAFVYSEHGGESIGVCEQINYYNNEIITINIKSIV